MRVHKKFVFSS